MSTLKEECGVFGISGNLEAANLTYLGLYSLQHRGQEGAGIVTADDYKLHSHRALGLVTDIFSKEVINTKLTGKSAIGHVRYSTTGINDNKNTQPITVAYEKGELAISHNGNLTNAITLRKELEKRGSIFQSTTDTEVIIHLIAKSKEEKIVDRIISALKECKGAYSLLFLTPDKMIAARDPRGFRPLVLGKLNKSYVVSSETCAFELIGAEYIREVEPGEILEIEEEDIKSYKPFLEVEPAPCVFELIYFARPDSFFTNKNVYMVRKKLGRQLAIEHPVDADLVIAVPDSGAPAAIGFAEQLNVPIEMGLLRSHYVGRTFIEPQQSIRDFGVKLKLSAVKEVINGKKVVVIDDSIVRGTTSRKIVKMIKDAGAKEVHMRISSPPMRYPCYYGIDTPSKEELIANSLNIEEINHYIMSDSIGYLSIEGMRKVVENNSEKDKSYCNACFTGRYMVELTDARLNLAQRDLFYKQDC